MSCQFEFVGKMNENHETREQLIRSTYQSIEDLFNQLSRLNQALSLSNATTKVKIGDREYTVAEAIATKATMKIRLQLLSKLEQDHATAENDFLTEKARQEQRLDNLFRGDRGKSDGDVSLATDIDEFMKRRGSRKCDPLNLSTLISKMHDEIAEFETQVDFRLSSINSITMIDV